MQAVLPSCSDIVAMHVAGTFNHSPTSPAQESPFVLTDPRHAGFESPGLIVPGHLPDITPRLDSTGPVRRRRTSKSLSLKRSASTPNVRSSSQRENMLNDKKRNKLGYHRTSVACVHCRRRKIRCLLAPDDPQNRCANCIRLKKECNFYPVDQQPPHEKRSGGSGGTGFKAEDKSNGNSSPSSSPEFVPGPTTELVDDTYNPYHPPAMDQQRYPTGPHPNEPSPFSPPNSAVSFPPNFDFATQRQTWDQHNGHHQIQHRHQQPQAHYDQSYHPDPSRREYWHHHQQQPETPISPPYSYPPIPPSDQSSIHDGHLYTRTGQPVHPTRSQSFSHVENLQHDNDPFHAQASIMMQHDAHHRRATATSDMLAPSLRNSAASSMASITDGPPITYGGPPQTGSLPFDWAPPAIPPHSSQSPKPNEFAHPGTMWPYAEQQNALPKLQEEQEGRIEYVQEPTMLYSNAPHQ